MKKLYKDELNIGLNFLLGLISIVITVIVQKYLVNHISNTNYITLTTILSLQVIPSIINFGIAQRYILDNNKRYEILNEVLICTILYLIIVWPLLLIIIDLQQIKQIKWQTLTIVGFSFSIKYFEMYCQAILNNEKKYFLNGLTNFTYNVLRNTGLIIIAITDENKINEMIMYISFITILYNLILLKITKTLEFKLISNSICLEKKVFTKLMNSGVTFMKISAVDYFISGGGLIILATLFDNNINKIIIGIIVLTQYVTYPAGQLSAYILNQLKYSNNSSYSIDKINTLMSWIILLPIFYLTHYKQSTLEIWFVNQKDIFDYYEVFTVLIISFGLLGYINTIYLWLINKSKERLVSLITIIVFILAIAITLLSYKFFATNIQKNIIIFVGIYSMLYISTLLILYGYKSIKLLASIIFLYLLSNYIFNIEFIESSVNIYYTFILDAVLKCTITIIIYASFEEILKKFAIQFNN